MAKHKFKTRVKLTRMVETARKHELSEETRRKLHPSLVLVLGSLRTFRQHRARRNDQAAIAGLVANLLFALSKVLEPEHFSCLPVSSGDSIERSRVTLVSQVIDSSPMFQGANTDSLAEGFKYIFGLSDMTGARVCSDIHGAAPPEAQVFTGMTKEMLESLRSNRDPQPAYRKASHNWVLMFLLLFGAMRDTGSDLSLGALTPEELKEVFDYACPACDVHSSEALRKIKKRFHRSVLKKWPSGTLKGNRKARRIEVRHST
jgi:hypothetical protein